MRTSPQSLPRRAAAVAALAGAAVLLVAGPAAAHVTVQPPSVAKDATDQTFAFRVPNEEDSANTVKVEVDFPTDHPIPSALVAPVPGWTDQIQTTKLTTPIHTDDGDITDVVSQIVWTGGQITPNHYQDFTVDFGALPDGTDQVVFKALQTYSDGTVVRWIDLQKPGQPEPDHPAPVLKLTDPATAATAATAAPKSGSDSTARALGIAGIVVGVLGTAAGVLLARRGRNSAA
ncbi:YcnI family protein [Kitasatospora sp. NBC_01287]|uniref:YcnI family copper-binding membrane protein n=1 Tax=Kitasatospora sp. NBC_01287 TaxID=2903573 RepID=UPI00224CDC1D|nr:YcnI family protein [Kitasatospora sp. NBC_01287]MCX4744409.1 YcnI family protein [Kitasatospora sp. NBC_01287]